MRPAPSTAKIYAMHLLTLGLYFFYWCANSRKLVNNSAQKDLVPPVWHLAIPLLNYVWVWEYANALEFVSFKRIKAVDTFCFFLIGTCFWFIFPAASNFAPRIGTAGEGEIVIGFLVALGVYAILNAIGLAFFCSTVQRRINYTNPTGVA